MSSDFIEDRGPAEYFHGRTEIINTFNSALKRYREKKRGSTFLIQGAPGAGKTALLDVLSTQAKSADWKVADITIKNLHSPVSLAQSLGKSYTIDKEYALQAGIKFIGGGLVESVAGHASAEEILKHLAPETGLILVLDEAQYLQNLKETPKEQILARDTLDVIHNGKVGRPVMLLTAGLGTTETAYGSLGISRINGDCTVQLGRLDKKSECAVIRDWLIEEGRVQGDPQAWIQSIAEQAHGWPQHIISYIKPALKYLESNNRFMTDEGLKFVLEKGAEYREMYYETRAHDIDEDHRQALARAVMDVPTDKTTTKPAITSSLKKSGLTKKEAGKLFNQALEQGIIDQRKGGRYGIPIPSFHTWLVDEYVIGKSQGIHQPPKLLPPKPTQVLLPPPMNDDVSEVKNKDKDKGQGGLDFER